jgi:hypothetical protein
MTNDNRPLLPPIGRPLYQGEHIRITCEGRTVDGEVTLASANGRSIVVMFEAILAGHAGMMPVMQEDDGRYFSLIGRVPLDIVRDREKLQ